MLSKYTHTSTRTLFSFIAIALLVNSATSSFAVSSAGGNSNSNNDGNDAMNSEKDTDTDIPTSPSTTTSIPTTSSTQPANAGNVKKLNSVVQNFRPAAGLKRIYRCGNTDFLANLFANNENGDGDDNDNGALPQVLPQYDVSSPEHIVLHKAGLILDLRGHKERHEAKAHSWMSQAPGGKFDVKIFERGGAILDFNTASESVTIDEGGGGGGGRGIHIERSVYRIDVISHKRCRKYLDKRTKLKLWLNLILKGFRRSFEAALTPLYEALIETSGEEFTASLKAITEYLESRPEGDVIVHCVQGKDRTGLTVMLCQLMLGIDDATIIEDYHKSEMLLKLETKGPWSADKTLGGKFKKAIIQKCCSGAPKEAMVSTLAAIRGKYGSINQYLDHIGFGDAWRQRFIATQSTEKLMEEEHVK